MIYLIEAWNYLLGKLLGTIKLTYEQSLKISFTQTKNSIHIVFNF